MAMTSSQNKTAHSSAAYGHSINRGRFFRKAFGARPNWSWRGHFRAMESVACGLPIDVPPFYLAGSDKGCSLPCHWLTRHRLSPPRQVQQMGEVHASVPRRGFH